MAEGCEENGATQEEDVGFGLRHMGIRVHFRQLGGEDFDCGVCGGLSSFARLDPSYSGQAAEGGCPYMSMFDESLLGNRGCRALLRKAGSLRQAQSRLSTSPSLSLRLWSE
jgi:hypothetical protein